MAEKVGPDEGVSSMSRNWNNAMAFGKLIGGVTSPGDKARICGRNCGGKLLSGIQFIRPPFAAVCVALMQIASRLLAKQERRGTATELQVKNAGTCDVYCVTAVEAVGRRHIIAYVLHPGNDATMLFAVVFK